MLRGRPGQLPLKACFKGTRVDLALDSQLISILQFECDVLVIVQQLVPSALGRFAK